MNILISGGAGFLGSNLSALLLSEGHHVWAVDNLITGRRENLDELIDNPNFSFIEQDIISPTILDRVEGTKFDAVFHMASPASPPWYQKYPLETLEVNSIGTKHMLEIAKRNNAKLIFASTSEVYGDPLEHPQKETYWGNVNSFGARSCYDEAKRYGEAICYTYLHDYDVDVRIVRIFNTYGPNMDPQDGRVVSNFVTQAIQGYDLTIYGDGSQTRAFCYVDDLIRGFHLMMTKDVKGEVINLGNPNEFTMLELAEKIIEKVGKSNQISYQDLPQDDPKKRRPDIYKAKELLGWEPEISLEKGLTKTIEYFKKTLNK